MNEAKEKQSNIEGNKLTHTKRNQQIALNLAHTQKPRKIKNEIGRKQMKEIDVQPSNDQNVNGK